MFPTAGSINLFSHHSITPNDSISALSADSPPAPRICKVDVSGLLHRLKIRKAPGADAVPPCFLRGCADQRDTNFTLIFNRWLELCQVPSCFKRSPITPVNNPPSQDLMTTGPWPWHLWSWNPWRSWCWPTWRTSQRTCWIPCRLHSGQTGQWMMQSTWTASHRLIRDKWRIHFVDFSSAFNTISQVIWSQLSQFTVQLPAVSGLLTSSQTRLNRWGWEDCLQYTKHWSGFWNNVELLWCRFHLPCQSCGKHQASDRIVLNYTAEIVKQYSVKYSSVSYNNYE